MKKHVSFYEPENENNIAFIKKGTNSNLWHVLHSFIYFYCLLQAAVIPGYCLSRNGIVTYVCGRRSHTSSTEVENRMAVQKRTHYHAPSNFTFSTKEPAVSLYSITENINRHNAIYNTVQGKPAANFVRVSTYYRQIDSISSYTCSN